MRKIYTVVFALMVLLSVTMSAMASEQAPEPMPEYSKIAVVVIILEAPAPELVEHIFSGACSADG